MRRHLDLIRHDLEPRIGALQFDRRAMSRWLLGLSLLALASAALGCALDGYHFGFARLNALGAPLPEAWLQRLTHCGDSLFALLLLLLIVRRHPELVWLALLATLIAALLSHGIKPLVSALRPAASLAPDSFRLIGPGYRLSSFPSGHTITAFVTAGVFGCLARSGWLRALLLGLALLVGWSRIAVGAHWPIDVLGGIAVGCLSLWLAIRLMDGWRRQLRPSRLLVLVLLLAAAAAAALFHIPSYPEARPQQLLLALGTLLLTLYDFLVLPLQRRREVLESNP